MSSEFNRHETDFHVLHRVSEHLYTYVTPFLFDGKHPIHNRSVIVHVPSRQQGEKGALAIINPAELRPEMASQLERLATELNARITHLISPGDWHYLFIAQHLAAFPTARAYVPPGRIPAKNPDFAYTLIDVAADELWPELAPQLQALSCRGLLDFTDPAGALPRHEFVFFFPEARAITSGDVFNYYGVGEFMATMKAAGRVVGRVDFHSFKRRMIKSPEALERTLEQILAWDFDRYVSIHGEPGNMLEQGAKGDIARILTWLKEATHD